MQRDPQTVLDRELELILSLELEDVSVAEALKYLDEFPQQKRADEPSAA